MAFEKAVRDGRIVFFGNPASPAFWDERWGRIVNDAEQGLKLGTSWYANRAVTRWLPRGSRCLDAGCGLGNLVYGLTRSGWPCVGVDFAEETIHKLRSIAPDLDFRCGDIRNLPFADREFDCCICDGVFAHQPDGYLPYLVELDRVLRPGGLLIVSFLSSNLLNRIKRALRRYPSYDESRHGRLQIFEVVLDPRAVGHDLEERGYQLLETIRYEGILGLANDLPRPIEKQVMRVYGHPSRMASAVRRLLEPLLRGWAGYCSAVVARKSAAGASPAPATRSSAG